MGAREVAQILRLGLAQAELAERAAEARFGQALAASLPTKHVTPRLGHAEKMSRLLVWAARTGGELRLSERLVRACARLENAHECARDPGTFT